MDRLATSAARTSRALACAAAGGLMLLALTTVVDIVLRYVFASPLRGFVDIAALVGAVLLAACFPHLLASRGNIAIDTLGQCLGDRARRWLDRFAATVSAGFFAVMAWQYVVYAVGLRTDGQTIPVLRWPVWPWWAAVAACVVLAAVVALLTVGRSAEGDA